MLKKHYVIVFFVILAALGGGVLLMPKSQEVALMQMKDKHFDEARVSYERQLADGNLTLEVVTHLTDLYLQTGAIDKAIEVMERFIAAYPADIEARRKVGTLYQYAQRQDDYLRNLEEINRLNPQAENLKILSDIYNFNTKYDEQAETLRKLIETQKGSDPEPFIDLAAILATRQNYAEAITTLQALKQNHKEAFTYKEEELLVTLLLDEKRVEEAIAEAGEWIATHPEASQAGRLITLVQSKGGSEQAAKLLSRYSEEEINASPDLLEAHILLQLSDGKEEEAYALLNALWEQGKLRPELHQRLLFLAAARRETLLVKSILAETTLTTLSEPQLVALTELAVTGNDKELLALISKTFADARYEETHPVLSAVLAVANRSKGAETKLSRLAKLDLTAQQSLQIARVCARYKNYSCSETFLSRIGSVDTLSDAELASQARLYLELRQFDKGHAFVSETLKTRPSAQLRQVALQYAAARGDREEIAAWLAGDGDKANSQEFSDIYFTAAANKQWPVATLVAAAQYEKHPSRQSKSLLATAYAKSGRHEDAVTLLTSSQPLSEDDEATFLASLSALSGTPQYRDQLAAYASSRLNAKISQKEKMALVYALVNARRIDIAMPAIRELALREGGQWAALYADTLDKQGKHDEARTFWVTVASQSATPAAQKRQIAYNLLEHGYKDDAVKIFTAIANTLPASDPAIADLLYLWGPRPLEERVEWIESRYTRAGGDEKGRWLAFYAQYASPESLAAFTQRHPEALGNAAVTRATLLAAVRDGSFKNKIAHAVSETQGSGQTGNLREYAKVAQEYGFAPEAADAWRVIAAQNPDDNAALREAGLAAYNNADYTASVSYLNEYIRTPSSDTDAQAWRAHFYFGELQRRYKQPEIATAAYESAIDNIERNRLESAEALSVKAQSQVWLGQAEDGIATFESARETYPNDDVLRADQAATLIELKRYDQARALLERAPGAPAPAADAPPLPYASDIAHYTLLDNDSELLIAFTQPLSKGVSVKPQQMLAAPGVAYVNEGYDTMLVSAQPGYRFEIISEEGKDPAIAISSDASSVDQLTLRYELLSARLELETGHVYDATARINRLNPEASNDPQLLGFAANAENYGGNWPRAQALLARARVLSPSNEDLASLERDSRRINAPNAKIDYEWIRRGDSIENIVTLSGYADASDHLQVGIVLQHDDANAKNVRRVDGRVGTFDGERQRGELYALYHDENGIRAQASFFANNDTPGAGLYFTFLNPLGETGIEAEWRRPYWEYTVGVLDDANRDRVAVTHTVKPRPDVTISGGPSLNRYNTADVDDVMSTAEFELAAVWRLIDEQPFLALTYGFDGEYDLDHKKGVDATGDYTRLFPLQSRELHVLSLNGGYEFSPQTYGNLIAGYGIDRLGGSGPVIEGRLTHEFTPSLDAQLRAYYGLSGSDSDDSLTRLGAYARWRF